MPCFRPAHAGLTAQSPTIATTAALLTSRHIIDIEFVPKCPREWRATHTVGAELCAWTCPPLVDTLAEDAGTKRRDKATTSWLMLLIM